jgi:hypothetical protein
MPRNPRGFSFRRRRFYQRPRYRRMSYHRSTCDYRCWNAVTPPSACRCSCGGANHGGRYRRVIRRRNVTPQAQQTSADDYFKSVGKAAMTSAVIYGLSTAAPPLGAVLIPAYTTYNYSKLGYGLLKVYMEISSQGEVSPDTMKGPAASVGGTTTQGPADAAATAVIARASQSGLFTEMAARTGVQEQVIAEMMRGSTSSALSASGGELAKFAIAKAVGA